jgi:predicted enzyme related to lactoylglutathione lyase
MLREGRVATRLPAQDLERARAFYSEKLGLEPVEERRAPLAEGNYPSKGTGERAVWFSDSEGNLLGIGQPTAVPGRS